MSRMLLGQRRRRLTKRNVPVALAMLLSLLPAPVYATEGAPDLAGSDDYEYKCGWKKCRRDSRSGDRGGL